MVASVAAVGLSGLVGVTSRAPSIPAKVVADGRDGGARLAVTRRDDGLADQVLAGAAAKGDDQAFAELVSRFQTPVYNLAYRMLGCPQDAEDATQEAFLRAYSKLSSYRPEAKFGTWLLSIAAHHCIDQLRRKQSVSLEDIPDMDWPGREDEEPEAASLEGERRGEVQALLEVLPPMYRAPLVLRYWYDHSYAEIAKVLRVSEATVKTRLFRARQMLADARRKQTVLQPIAC